MEAADRMLGRYVAIAPGGLVLRTRHTDKGQPHAVRVGEGQHWFAEALFQRLERDALLLKALGPVAQGSLGNPERRFLRFTDAAAAGGGAFPGEEGEDGTGPAGLISIIEMIAARIVEIDGLLDETQTQIARVEREVLQRIACDGCDVMDARHLSFLRSRMRPLPRPQISGSLDLRTIHAFVEGLSMN